VNSPAKDKVLEAGVVENKIISGRYQLETEIGAGGMARVWRAHDLTLDRPVAVKFLFLREDRDQMTMIDRFLREARIAASVRHVNVVDVLDFGTMPSDGRPFMVMELLEGQSLDDRLGVEPTMAARDLVSILGAALAGLGAVHKVGIVHRDLKPDNLFLVDGDDGVRPKLLDFGVSRDTDASSGRRSALTTSAGYLVGTPEYMSPEQARGLKDVDWRTDIYSLGVVLYEALTGTLPYDAEAVGDLIIAIVGGSAPSVFEVRPEVGQALSDVVARAMASDREDRFQSAKEMRVALVEAAEGSSLSDLLTVVPVRKLRGELVAPPSLNSIEGELAWGVGAVPSFGAGASLESSETPDETPETPSAEPAAPPNERAELAGEEASPRARKTTASMPDATAVVVPPTSKRWMWLAPLAAVVAVAGAAAYLALPGPDAAPGVTPPVANEGVNPPAQPEAEVPPEVVAPPEAPTEIELPEPLPPAEVSVSLSGVPDNATVFIDDVSTDLAEGALVMPRDSAEHEIRVEAPRRRPWSTTHRADEDGSYRVQLRRVGGGQRRGRTGSGVFRNLDY